MGELSDKEQYVISLAEGVAANGKRDASQLARFADLAESVGVRMTGGGWITVHTSGGDYRVQGWRKLAMLIVGWAGVPGAGLRGIVGRMATQTMLRSELLEVAHAEDAERFPAASPPLDDGLRPALAAAVDSLRGAAPTVRLESAMLPRAEETWIGQRVEQRSAYDVLLAVNRRLNDLPYELTRPGVRAMLADAAREAGIAERWEARGRG